MRIKGYIPIERDETLACIEVWYDHDIKLWVVQRKNSAGDQIGEVDHYAHKRDAIARGRDYLKDFEIKTSTDGTIETARYPYFLIRTKSEG